MSIPGLEWVFMTYKGYSGGIHLQVLSQVKFEMTMDFYIDEKDKELGRARLSQGAKARALGEG